MLGMLSNIAVLVIMFQHRVSISVRFDHSPIPAIPHSSWHGLIRLPEKVTTVLFAVSILKHLVHAHLGQLLVGM